MNKNENFNLIDGQFSVEEAKDVLTTLLQNKIAFHQRKNFSSVERTGREDQHSLERIEALQANCSKIIQWMDEMENMPGEVNIQAAVHVTFLQPA